MERWQQHWKHFHCSSDLLQRCDYWECGGRSPLPSPAALISDPPLLVYSLPAETSDLMLLKETKGDDLSFFPCQGIVMYLHLLPCSQSLVLYAYCMMKLLKWCILGISPLQKFWKCLFMLAHAVLWGWILLTTFSQWDCYTFDAE